MKTTRISATFITTVVFVISTTTLFAGNLNPSAPPTSGTMKTLTEVEPRIGIPASETPTSTYYINESGSYYLLGNRHCSGSGIQIQADNVTLDLNGYSIIGSGTGFYYGVDLSDHKNIEVKNGSVIDFGAYGIRGSSTLNNPGESCRILNIRAVSNGAAGYGAGIYMIGNNHWIEKCTASYNEGRGIQTNDACTVVSNTVSNNTAEGIYCEDRCRIEHNTVNGNWKSGIFGNKYCSIINNTVCDNNTSQDSSQGGILVYYDCRVKDNEAILNKNANIYVNNSGNVIECNHFSRCTTIGGYGVYFAFPGNFYANNRAFLNSTNYGGTLPLEADGGDGGGNASFDNT